MSQKFQIYSDLHIEFSKQFPKILPLCDTLILFLPETFALLPIKILHLSWNIVLKTGKRSSMF